MINYLFEKPFIPIVLFVLIAVGFRIAWGKTDNLKMRNACYASFALAVLIAAVAFFVTTPAERLADQLDTLQEELEEGNFDAVPAMLADPVTVAGPEGRAFEGPRDKVYADVQRVLKRYGVYAVKTKFGERVIDMKNNRATVEFRTLPLSKAHRIPPIRWLVTLEYANKEWTITRAKSLGIIMPGEGD